MINSWNGSEPPSGLIQHIKRWNKWRKHNCNGRFHKLLVLLGMRKSPTFILTLTDEEEAYYMSYVLHRRSREIYEALMTNHVEVVPLGRK